VHTSRNDTNPPSELLVASTDLDSPFFVFAGSPERRSAAETWFPLCACCLRFGVERFCISFNNSLACQLPRKPRFALEETEGLLAEVAGLLYSKVTTYLHNIYWITNK